MDRLAKAIDEVDSELASLSRSGRTMFGYDEVADLLLDVRQRMRAIHDLDSWELDLWAARR